MIDTGAARPTRRWRAALGAALLTLYRLVWIALFAAGVVTLGLVAPRQELAHQAAYAAAAAFGFDSQVNPSTAGQLGAPLGDDGRRIGYRADDLLLTFDGRIVPVDKAAQARALGGPAGASAVLGLRRATGERYVVRVVRDPARLATAYAGWGITYQSRRWIQFGFEMASTFALLIAAMLLFIRRPRDPMAQLLSFTIVLGGPDYSQLPHVGPFVGETIGGIYVILFVTVLLLFPDGRLNTRWHWLAVVTIVVANVGGLISLALNISGDMMNLVSAAAYAAMLLAVVARYRRTPEGIARQQGKFVLFGIAGFCVLAAAGALLLLIPDTYPASVGAEGRFALSGHVAVALALTMLPAGLFVSLFRYRLYDAESTISRSVVYGTLTLALLAIFAGSEKMIEILGEQYFGERLGAVAGALGAGFAAFMMVPLHHRVTHWAERRFQGDLVHLRSALPVLVGDMAATATPARLADTLLARVEAGVRAAHGIVVAGDDLLAVRDIDIATAQAWLATWLRPADDGCELTADRGDPLFPLRVPLCSDGAGLAGWLLLGPRPDGSFYGRDEREALLAIAEPVARALAVAHMREAEECERRREIGGLATRLGALEIRLGSAPLAA